MRIIMTEEQQARYPKGWDPTAWHDNVRNGIVKGPRWRIKEDAFHERDRLCQEFDELNQRMAKGSFDLRKTMSDLAEWERMKEAILSCEELEDGTDPVRAYRERMGRA